MIFGIFLSIPKLATSLARELKYFRLIFKKSQKGMKMKFLGILFFTNLTLTIYEAENKLRRPDRLSGRPCLQKGVRESTIYRGEK